MGKASYLMRAAAIILVVGMCGSAVAQVTYFVPNRHGGGDPHDWMNPNNWDYAGTPTGVPGAGSHVIIHDFSPGWTGMPIISSAVPDVAVLTPSWHGVASHLAIQNGGSIKATGFTRLGNDPASNGQISINNGSLTTDTLQMSMSSTAKAQVNLNRGTMRVGTPTSGGIGFHATAPQNIDLERGATLYIGGNRTASGSGEIPWWTSAAAGKVLSAMDGTGKINATYNAATGFTEVTASDPFRTFYTAGFEDGEVNPGKLSGVVNTTPYPAGQPGAFGQVDAFGWQNRVSNFTTGDTTIVDTQAFDGSNSALVVNRFLRSDINHTLEAGTYRFRFWYMVPDGMPLTFQNRIVVRDQTHNIDFVNEPTTMTITAPSHNVWFSRTVTFDTTGSPWIGSAIDLRFGATFTGTSAGMGAYTDAWSMAVVPDPATILLIGFGGLAVVRRRIAR